VRYEGYPRTLFLVRCTLDYILYDYHNDEMVTDIVAFIFLFISARGVTDRIRTNMYRCDHKNNFDEVASELHVIQFSVGGGVEIFTGQC